MKFILFFILFCTSSVVHSQAEEIKWGELSGNQGSLLYLLPKKKNEFFALRWVGGRMLGSYQVTKHKNLEFESKKKIKLITENSISNFEGARVFNDRFVTFLSDRKENANHFYIQEYSDDLQETKEPLKLASYNLDRSRKKGGFRTVLSKNKKFLGVIWVIPGRKNERDLYGFNVYDTSYNLINEGEYPLPFDPQMSTIHSHHISDKGDYFMAITEFAEKQKDVFFKSHLNYKALHIFRINEEGLDDYTIDLKGKRVEAMSMTSDENNVFILSGIYGTMNIAGVKGIFHQRVDLNTGEKLSEGFKDFEESFITQDWSERARKRAEKQKSRGRGEPQLYDYKMRDITILPDGTIVGTMEQFYVHIRTYNDPRTGTSSQSYQYYYNDIIAFKINHSGDFDWIKKIRKFQVSTNDEGPYSSYQSYISDGKVNFIFNDHIKNYTNGEYIDPDKIAITSYTKKKNAVAMASIDIETGKTSRRVFLERMKTKTLIIPKLFEVDYLSNEVIIYSTYGRKEKIGILEISN